MGHIVQNWPIPLLKVKATFYRPLSISHPVDRLCVCEQEGVCVCVCVCVCVYQCKHLCFWNPAPVLGFPYLVLPNVYTYLQIYVHLKMERKPNWAIFPKEVASLPHKLQEFSY